MSQQLFYPIFALEFCKGVAVRVALFSDTVHSSFSARAVVERFVLLTARLFFVCLLFACLCFVWLFVFCLVVCVLFGCLVVVCLSGLWLVWILVCLVLIIIIINNNHNNHKS